MNATLNIPIDAVKALCRRHRVRELAVFGSALGPDFRLDSDVDLLVDFEPDAEVGFLEFAALQNELSDLLRRKVDLVPKRGLKHLIRDDILTRGLVL